MGPLWDLTYYKCLRATEVKKGLDDVLLVQEADLQQTEIEGARDYRVHVKKKKILLVKNLDTQI